MFQSDRKEITDKTEKRRDGEKLHCLLRKANSDDGVTAGRRHPSGEECTLHQTAKTGKRVATITSDRDEEEPRSLAFSDSQDSRENVCVKVF